MDVIDSEEKAYLLSWIAYDGWFTEDGITSIAVNTCNVGVLEVLRKFICPDLPVTNHSKGTMRKLCTCSTQWYKVVQEHLNLSFEKGKSYKNPVWFKCRLTILTPSSGVFCAGCLKAQKFDQFRFSGPGGRGADALGSGRANGPGGAPGTGVVLQAS